MKRGTFPFTEISLVLLVLGIIFGSTFLILKKQNDDLEEQFRQDADEFRLFNLSYLQSLLEDYYEKHGRYPSPGEKDCDEWDVGNAEDYDDFMKEARVPGETYWVLADPTAKGKCQGFRYARYPAGSYGCPASCGAYYVLEATDMESTEGPHPQSPGWKCPERDWQKEAEWVTGKFENPSCR